MLPGDKQPWAKTVARTVICATVVALIGLAYFLETRGSLRIPEIVGIFLLFLTIVPPNLAVLYPGLLPTKHGTAGRSKTNSASSK